MPDPTPKHPPVKLTKSYIDRIKPGISDEFHWCVDPKGFGLRVTPTGKMTFIVQGRLDPKKPAARIGIGPFGVFTVEQAREVAREHLRSMRMGVDPGAVKKQQEAEGVTLKQAYDSYVSRPGNAMARERLKPSGMFGGMTLAPVVGALPPEPPDDPAVTWHHGRAYRREGSMPQRDHRAETEAQMAALDAIQKHREAEGQP